MNQNATQLTYDEVYKYVGVNIWHGEDNGEDCSRKGKWGNKEYLFLQMGKVGWLSSIMRRFSQYI